MHGNLIGRHSASAKSGASDKLHQRDGKAAI